MLLPQLPHLLLSKVLLIRRVSFEGKGVVWVLRMLLMVDILHPILPVRELSCIAACLLNRGSIKLSLTEFPLLGLNLEGLEVNLVRG